MLLLRQAWRAWKRFAQILGDMSARLILTILYFTLVVPFGLGVRLSCARPGTGLERASGWLDRTTHDRTVADARRQF